MMRSLRKSASDLARWVCCQGTPAPHGVWVLVTDAVSVFAGTPANYVVLAVAGGGGFLVAAAWFALRRSRAVTA